MINTSRALLMRKNNLQNRFLLSVFKIHLSFVPGISYRNIYFGEQLYYILYKYVTATLYHRCIAMYTQHTHKCIQTNCNTMLHCCADICARYNGTPVNCLVASFVFFKTYIQSISELGWGSKAFMVPCITAHFTDLTVRVHNTISPRIQTQDWQ